jgi:transposase InsO family protein
MKHRFVARLSRRLVSPKSDEGGSAAKAAVKTIYITPRSPWENAYIESFHDKLREECMNREIFGSLWETRVVIEQWRLHYNAEWSHSPPGHQTPEEFAGRTNGCS